MSKTDLVSIIIPIYNGEKYIYNTINSIINQTYKNFELIVINDGSQDNTVREIEKIKDERICLYNKENSGVSDTRNFGIDHATGEYLMFVDADDMIEKTLLEKLVEIIEANDVDIVRYNGFIQDKKGNYHGIEFPINNQTILSAEENKEEIISLINKPCGSLRCYSPFLFFKNNNIIKFRKELKYLEDKVFYLENLLNENKKTIFIDEKLYYYQYNDCSKTKSVEKFKENMEDLLEAQNIVKKIVDGVVLSNAIDLSSASLICYRLEYLSSEVSLFEFCKIAKKILAKKSISSVFDVELVGTNKYISIQINNIRKKMFLLFYCICVLKKIVKKVGI